MKPPNYLGEAPPPNRAAHSKFLFDLSIVLRGFSLLTSAAWKSRRSDDASGGTVRSVMVTTRGADSACKIVVVEAGVSPDVISTTLARFHLTSPYLPRIVTR